MSVKKTVILVTIFIFFIVSYSENLYEEYKKANNEFKKKEFKIAQNRIEKILMEFKEYKEANLLYFKILYEENDIKKLSRIFIKIIENYNDVQKKELFYFLLAKNDILRLEKVYASIENKKDIKEVFFKKLYENKKYNIILEKSGNNKYVKLIEKDKSSANQYFYTALEKLQENKQEKAIELIGKAIKEYPIDYRYYFKLGQIYADKKNYRLAEINLLKALNLVKKDEIYLTLFRLYLKTNDQEKLYKISKNIIFYPEVQNELRKKYKENKSEEKFNILKRKNNVIYISTEDSQKWEIGNTYYLQQKKENFYDRTTGETLLKINEQVARIRVIDKKKRVVIFYILDEYKKINLAVNYIIN